MMVVKRRCLLKLQASPKWSSFPLWEKANQPPNGFPRKATLGRLPWEVEGKGGQSCEPITEEKGWLPSSHEW